MPAALAPGTVETPDPRSIPLFSMKFSLFSIPLLAAAVTTLLPAARSRSQMLAPTSTDPMTELQELQTANEDLLKRQDATLKDLADMTDQANEVRIFSRRG